MAFTWPDVVIFGILCLSIVGITGLKLYFTHRYEDRDE